eukprot:4040422-Prymnesium_polylepis.1
MGRVHRPALEMHVKNVVHDADAFSGHAVCWHVTHTPEVVALVATSNVGRYIERDSARRQRTKGHVGPVVRHNVDLVASVGVHHVPGHRPQVVVVDFDAEALDVGAVADQNTRFVQAGVAKTILREEEHLAAGSPVGPRTGRRPCCWRHRATKEKRVMVPSAKGTVADGANFGEDV